MNRMILALTLVLSGTWGAVAGATEPEAMNYWPAWRGPLANGVAPHGHPPTEWSETKNIRWKVELPGPGHASPIVWGDRIYVLATIKTDKLGTSTKTPPASSLEEQAPQQDRHRRGPPRAEKPTHLHQFAVLALDRKTGKSIWQTVVREEVPHEPGHLTASQASASPVTDGEHIFAFFGSRGLYCLDRNGTVKWEKDFGEMRTRNEFGEGSSPVLHGGTIVINWDHEGDSFIVALDKRTGEQRWKVPRDEPTSWSTPLVIDDGGRPLVVVSATNRVRAYDLKTGEVVWECGGLGLNCIPTPVTDSGLIYVMSGYREAAGMAIRYAGARGDLTGSDAVVWRIDGGTSYVPSPLLYDGKLFFVDRFRAMLMSYDLKTGQPHWPPQRLEGLGNIYASPVGADGRVYLMDRDGNSMVIRQQQKFEVLAQNKLDDTFDASPAIAGDELFLRGHKFLYCVAER